MTSASKTKPRSSRTKAPDAGDESRRRLSRELVAEIAEHDRRYHTEDAPTISDGDYDALRRKLVAMEAEHPEFVADTSPSKKVGAKPSDKFAKVRHKVGMLSLGNVFADDEVEEFCGRVRRFLGLKPEDAARLRRRAQDRRAFLLAALRGRRAGAGLDTRRRPGGRGRHRERPHHRRDPARA